MSFQDRISNFIESSANVDDLLIIFKALPLETVKRNIMQNIQLLNEDSQRKIFYELMPVTKILNDDELQHVLSFLDFREIRVIKLICKKFKILTEKNELNYFRKLYQKIYIGDQSQNKNTYILDWERSSLNHIETDLGFKGPYQKIEKLIDSCNNNARILIHGGIYEIKENFVIRKNLRIKGIICRKEKCAPIIYTKACITFKSKEIFLTDITIKLEHFYNSSIFIDSNAKVQAYGCQFDGSEVDHEDEYQDGYYIDGYNGTLINVAHNASFTAESCIFADTEQALWISSTAKRVSLYGNIFNRIRNFPRSPELNWFLGCIKIKDEDYEIQEHIDPVNVNFSSNLFVEIDQKYPFVWQSINNEQYNKAYFSCNLHTIQFNKVEGHHLGKINEFESILNE